MMHIKVDNHHSFESIAIKSVARCDCYVIEEAEAHRRFRDRVMTRRANQAIGVVDLAFHDRIDSREGRSRGSNSCLV